MYAVIKTGGKQYVVTPGKKIKVEKLQQFEGEVVTFSEVLAAFDDTDTFVGKPMVPGTTVEGKVVRHGRAKKITNLRFHSKTRYRRKQGHRQHFTEVEITDIKR
jgi:large subunit ribosomal protein L21